MAREVDKNLNEFYRINGFVFNKTGQQSNRGWEYEVRKDNGADYYQYHNIYASNYNDLLEYAMSDEEE